MMKWIILLIFLMVLSCATGNEVDQNKDLSIIDPCKNFEYMHDDDFSNLVSLSMAMMIKSYSEYDKNYEKKRKEVLNLISSYNKKKDKYGLCFEKSRFGESATSLKIEKKIAEFYLVDKNIMTTKHDYIIAENNKKKKIKKLKDIKNNILIVKKNGFQCEINNIYVYKYVTAIEVIFTVIDFTKIVKLQTHKSFTYINEKGGNSSGTRPVSFRLLDNYGNQFDLERITSEKDKDRGLLSLIGNTEKISLKPGDQINIEIVFKESPLKNTEYLVLFIPGELTGNFENMRLIIPYSILKAEQERLEKEPKKLARIEAERKRIEAKKKKLLAMSKRPPKPKSKKITNSLGMEFVYIPPGSFIMGSPANESDPNDHEKQHRVTLTKGFYMQITEVTQGQWKAVMGNNPSYFKNCGDSCPVEKVSWYDSQSFIIKLNRREEGDKYRLPTEAEWEYAARAGTTTAFANGGISELKCSYDANLDAMGWYCGNSGKRTHRVAGKEPNRWGLYDMHGNVWEWCEDWYDYYPSGHVTDPTGPSGPDPVAVWVYRGGCWKSYAGDCRSAVRNFNTPYRFNFLGFRLALSPGQ